MAQAVEFTGRDARFDEGGDVIQHFGAEAAGNAHAFDVFGGMDGNSHGVGNLCEMYR
ncbi:hypothetical protein D3C85_1875880 [compost metagenome]